MRQYVNFTMYKSVRVIFDNAPLYDSVFEGTIDVNFDTNYLCTIRKILDQIDTEYFWFFAGFTDLKYFSFLDFVPKNKNMQVFYTTHPMGGYNKEGNVFLIHTKEFLEQLPWLKKLKQFNLINYHPDPKLYQRPILRTYFSIDHPFKEINMNYYTWYINKDLINETLPDFYPSFWEDQHAYIFGPTQDIMLLPAKTNWKKVIKIDCSYPIKELDVCELPSNTDLTRVTAAALSKTNYFWGVPIGTNTDNFDFSFQPDRTIEPKHYKFENNIVLFNKKLILDNKGKIDV